MFSNFSFCQISLQRQIVYLECRGAYVQMHSLFNILCVDMHWDIKWHSWFSALNIFRNTNWLASSTVQVCNAIWVNSEKKPYKSLRHEKHSSYSTDHCLYWGLVIKTTLGEGLLWISQDKPWADIWKIHCQVISHHLKEIYCL